MEKEAVEIKSITAVNKEGSHFYEVGQVINDLAVHKIVDNSVEWENSIDFMYTGETESGATIFEINNIGVDIQYCKLI